jgi:hypothetical protein
MKAVLTGSFKAIVGTRAGSRAGAGAETNSFGSTTLQKSFTSIYRTYLTVPGEIIWAKIRHG